MARHRCDGSLYWRLVQAICTALPNSGRNLLHGVADNTNLAHRETRTAIPRDVRECLSGAEDGSHYPRCRRAFKNVEI